MNKTIEVNIPSCQELYDSLPADCKDKYVKLFSDDELAISMYQALQYHYTRIISMMINDCSNAVRPAVYMGLFDKSGNQCICNWSASDNNKPVENSYNFHGQNTSRWIIAGCLLYDIRDNTFSIHT
jgi:hypothetical protein